MKTNSTISIVAESLQTSSNKLNRAIDGLFTADTDLSLLFFHKLLLFDELN